MADTIESEVVSASQVGTLSTSGFVPGAQYEVEVRAHDGTVYSDWSLPKSFYTVADVTAVPAEISLDTGSPTVSAGATINAIPAGMTLHAVPSDIPWNSKPQVASDATSGVFDTLGLGPGIYELSVRAEDSVAGFGEWSTAVNFTVPAIIPVLAGGITLGATSPDLVAGAELNAVPGVVSLAAPAPNPTAEQRITTPPAALNLDAAPPVNIGGAYTIHVISPGIQLGTDGEITIYWNGLFAKPGIMWADAAPPTITVYQKPVTPTYTDLEYKAKFTDGFTKIIRRVEILEADGQTLWDDKAGNRSRLISGNVSVDYDRDERRSADIELANFDRGLIHKPEGFWYDKILRLWRGIEFYDVSGRRTYEVPVGSFMIDRVSEARFPKVVKVTARDYTKKCLLSKFTAATGFAAGTPVEDVIRDLAANVGVQRRVFPTTGKVLGIDTFFERGKSRWEAMKEIATAHGYELFFDAYGYLVMRPFLDPTLSPVSHEFLTGPSVGNLVDWDRSANDTRIFNHISVIGADTETIPVWADAYNTNPLSPTNIDLLGDRVDTYESPLVTTFAQAEELAQAFLKISALEEYEINMSSIVYPWLEAGEIVRFKDPERNDNEPDRFLLTSFNIPMGLEPMSAVGRRVVIVS